MKTFRQFLEGKWGLTGNDARSDILGLMQSIIANPSDVEIYGILGDALDDHGHYQEAEIMRRASDDIFHIIVYRTEARWPLWMPIAGPTSHPETTTRELQNETGSFEWAAQQIRKFGNSPVMHLIDTKGARGVGLRADDEKDWKRTRVKITRYMNFDIRGKEIPSLIMWLLLKAGHAN